MTTTADNYLVSILTTTVIKLLKSADTSWEMTNCPNITRQLHDHSCDFRAVNLGIINEC